MKNPHPSLETLLTRRLIHFEGEGISPQGQYVVNVLLKLNESTSLPMTVAQQQLWAAPRREFVASLPKYQRFKRDERPFQTHFRQTGAGTLLDILHTRRAWEDQTEGIII